MVQDFGDFMKCVGFDVEALYPSLNGEEVAKLLEEEVMRSSIRWKDLDYLEGARWLALHYSEEWCRSSSLKRVLPRRRKVNGTKPGVRGARPMGKETGDIEQWIFPEVVLSQEEKKGILAAITRLMTELMFNNHIYTFGGKMYRQVKGGPIGLRGTCALARVIMNIWDRLWERMLTNMNIQLEDLRRYMDDGRVFIHPIRRGWRWWEGKICYSKAWAREDEELSKLVVMRRLLEGSMQNVLDFLKFTTETEEDFPTGWLPTLDLELRMVDNMVQHRYYEKPTTAKVTVQQRSAMEEKVKYKILSNDLVRRMLNCMEELGDEEKRRNIDRYGQKLLNSGFNREQVVRILVAGLRCYDRKVARCKTKGFKLYRTAKDSSKPRQMKKLLGARDWYRRKRSREDDEPLPESNKRGRWEGEGAHQPREEGEVDMRSVIFVEYTPGGALAKRIREVLGRLQGLLGGGIKVVERTGTPLVRQFPLTRLWEGTPCPRSDCVTCTQGGGGEIYPCSRRNVVYENICLICHPEAAEKEGKLEEGVASQAVYVGESARSIYERSREHWDDYVKGETDSHILKHHVLAHGGRGEPQFHFRPVRFHRTALGRQLHEAVRIRRRGGEVVLNSKGEYNRCEIARLVLGDAGGGADVGEDRASQEREVRAWVKERTKNKKKSTWKAKEGWKVERIERRTKAKKTQRRETETVGVVDEDEVPDVANTVDGVTECEEDRKKSKEDDRPKRKRKKYNHQVSDKNWGEEVVINLQNIPPYTPQPQRQGCRLRGSRVVRKGSSSTKTDGGAVLRGGRGVDIRQYFKILRPTGNSAQGEKFYTSRDSTTFVSPDGRPKLGDEEEGAGGASGPTQIIMNTPVFKKSTRLILTPSSVKRKNLQDDERGSFEEVAIPSSKKVKKVRRSVKVPAYDVWSADDGREDEVMTPGTPDDDCGEEDPGPVTVYPETQMSTVPTTGPSTGGPGNCVSKGWWEVDRELC